MLNVRDDKLVVEEKGIYSIEKFIVARRLMYWQVYLHKTVVSAEKLLINVLKRAKKLAHEGETLFASPALAFFLKHDYVKSDFVTNRAVIDTFVKLDDFDIMGAIKVWQDHPDPILSDLCQRLVGRKLMRVQLSNAPLPAEEVADLRKRTMKALQLEEEDVHYYFETDVIQNHAYDPAVDRIDILTKDGRLTDLAEASDNQFIMAQTQTVKKYVTYLPKEVYKIE
jgi:HD superfamily phosphohydrolase